MTTLHQHYDVELVFAEMGIDASDVDIRQVESIIQESLDRARSAINAAAIQCRLESIGVSIATDYKLDQFTG